MAGLFNIVIAYGALFSGFLSDSRKPAMLPFCIGLTLNPEPWTLNPEP